VDIDDEEAAVDRAVRGEGTLIDERVYGVDPGLCTHTVSDAGDAKPGYEVIGVYLDTVNFQPFTHKTGAWDAREALLRTIAWARHGDDTDHIETFVSGHEGDNLRPLATQNDIRPVSIRHTGLTGQPAEELHEIDEFLQTS
jgi:hypothetical protein